MVYSKRSENPIPDYIILLVQRKSKLKEREEQPNILHLSFVGVIYLKSVVGKCIFMFKSIPLFLKNLYSCFPVTSDSCEAGSKVFFSPPDISHPSVATKDELDIISF